MMAPLNNCPIDVNGSYWGMCVFLAVIFVLVTTVSQEEMCLTPTVYQRIMSGQRVEQYGKDYCLVGFKART